MTDSKINNIVIVGGGTAGWMAAAMFAKMTMGNIYNIHLIESEDIPTIGVGEATIPQLQVFNRILGIDDNDFVKKTNGTFKLGIEFVNWGGIGESYIHPFGDAGREMNGIPFHHYWCKMHQQGKADSIENYTFNALASRENRFMRSIEAGNSPLSNIPYAYQFDAGRYALYLREFAEKLGVKRTLGTIVETQLRSEDGFIESVKLKDGQVVEGDFFVDCSGFQGLLIEKALGVKFIDWLEHLPCDRAWAVPSEKVKPAQPYTTSTAHSAGWQWYIPLQHRTGNGHVFSSQFMDEQEALDILLANIEGKPIADPKLIKFKAGKRETFWKKNCVAIGLASGFVEPLESTAIHLIQSSVARLLTYFPDKTFNQENIDFYNEKTHYDYDSLRDFIVLHYHATKRDDSDFWNYCRTMEISDRLKHRIEMFRENGHAYRHNLELFNEVSWISVFIGQGIVPKRYHPFVDALPESEIERHVQHVQNVIRSSVDQMPNHEQFIEQNCKADKNSMM